MTELRSYGGLGIPEDQFREAVQAIMDCDRGTRDFNRATRPSVDYYEDLLDIALRKLFPGKAPFPVKDFTVGVAPPGTPE